MLNIWKQSMKGLIYERYGDYLLLILGWIETGQQPLAKNDRKAISSHAYIP